MSRSNWWTEARFGLFVQFPFPGPEGKGRIEWLLERLIEMVRELPPGTLVNDRLDLLDIPGGP